MTKEEENELRTFETRVRQLLLAYNALKAENRRLQEALASREEALTAAGETARRLQEDYARLRMAKMMAISNGDLKEARRRVDRLVREVDKCIALLGV